MSKKRDSRIAVIGLRGFPGIQGGVESHCQEIWTRLAARGNDIIVYRRRPYVADKNADTPPGITFRDFPSTRIKGWEALWHSTLAALDIIIRRRADRVSIHNIGPGLVTPLLRLFGHKVVLTYHSPNYEHSKWGRLGRSILRLGEVVSLRFASRVIFVNRFQMEKFPERVRRKSIFIPNGITPATPLAATDFLTRHRLTPGRYILAVGRITPEKGFDDLIRAIQTLDPGLPLVIAGAPDHDIAYLDSLKALDTSRRVIFTGFTTGDNLLQLYSHARLFVMSSVNEGFPIAMLEAMTYGLPIIATDIPGTRLFPRSNDGKYPVYVKAGSPVNLARAISESLNLPDHKATYPLDEYTWDSIADRTLSVFDSLLHKQP